MPRASASSWPRASRASRVSCRDCPQCRNSGGDRGRGPEEDSLLFTPSSSPCWMATNRLRSPAEETRNGRVPAVVGGDDSILFPAVAGFHDAVAGTVAIVHFDAHLDLMDESPAQGRYSHSSGMRRALELPRVDQQRCVQVGTRSFNFPSSKRFIDEIGLAELPARMVRRCGTEWTFARIGEITRGADHIFLSVDMD